LKALNERKMISKEGKRRQLKAPSIPNHRVEKKGAGWERKKKGRGAEKV